MERTGGHLAVERIEAWEAGTAEPDLGSLLTWARQLNPFRPLVATYNGQRLTAEPVDLALQDMSDDDVYGPETAGGFRAHRFDSNDLRRMVDRDPLARAAYEDAHILDEVAAALHLNTTSVPLSQIPADQFTLELATYQPISSMDMILDNHWTARAEKLTVQDMARDLIKVHGVRDATEYIGMNDGKVVQRWSMDAWAAAPQRGSIIRGKLELAWAGTKRLEDSTSTEEAATIFGNGEAPGLLLGRAPWVQPVRSEFTAVIHRAVEGRPPHPGSEGFAVVTGKQEIGTTPPKVGITTAAPAVPEIVRRQTAPADVATQRRAQQ